jgi:hypothetical protein
MAYNKNPDTNNNNITHTNGTRSTPGCGALRQPPSNDTRQLSRQEQQTCTGGLGGHQLTTNPDYRPPTTTTTTRGFDWKHWPLNWTLNWCRHWYLGCPGRRGRSSPARGQGKHHWHRPAVQTKKGKENTNNLRG